MFHYNVQTNKTVEDAISSIQEQLQANKFGLLWQLNITEKLQDKGLDYNESFRVLEVCSPIIAEKVLNEDVTAGNFLPCKITVYENQGQTHIGFPKPTVLFGLTGNERLMEIAKEVEHILVSIVDASK